MYRLKNAGIAMLLATLVVLATGCPAEKEGKLVGWVTDATETPLPFVTVSALGEKVNTDGSGLFVFDAVRADKNIPVAFALEGYADTTRVIRLEAGATNTLNVAMKRLNAEQALANPGAGGTFSDKGGALSLPGGAVDAKAANGAKAASATVRVTSVDLTRQVEASSLPGDLRVALSGGRTGLLDACALVNFLVTVDGAPADFQAGASATAHFNLAAGSGFTAGDTVPLWHFDASAGAWMRHGTGTVTAGAGSSLYVEGTISDFGWWCCAPVETNPFTITGHVYDAAGQPVARALVIAHGANYHGATWAASDEDGAYALKVLPNANAHLELVLPGAYYVADTLDVATGEPGGVMENQDLAPDFRSAITGHVTEEDGTTPVPGVQVYSSAGGSAVTAEDGAFCMPAPGSTGVAVYVLGRPPMFTTTPETATCEAGDGADVTISVYYPRDGDRLGFVFGTLRTAEFPFVGYRKYLAASALFYSGFKGDQFAPCDPDAALDEYKVYTATPQPGFDLGIYLGLLSPALAFNLAFKLDFGVNETFALDDGEAPSIMKIGALDAGSPGLFTNGQKQVDMWRPLDFFHGFNGNGSLQDLGYAMLEPWMGGFFFQKGFASQGFNNGDTLTFSWPGGIDMGAFSAQGVVPGELDLTAPRDLSTAFDDDALQNGLPVTWNTQGQGNYVSLILETIVIDHLLGPVRVGALVCKAADDGAYTIPAEALAQMPQLTTHGGTQINYLFAKRHTVAKASVPLARGDGNGYVVVTIGTDPVMLWSLDAHYGLK